MHEDITRLVDQLEAAAKDSTRTVKVVSIKGVDPILVQQAIDAIQGRRTVTPTRPSSDNGSSGRRSGRSGDSGSSGFTPFGTGGFMPGSSTPGFPSGSFNQPSGGFRGFPSGGGGNRGDGDRGPPGSGQGGDGGGGSRFFADRVKDDPSLTLLYDPQHDQIRGHVTASMRTAVKQHLAANADTHFVSFEEEQQAPPAGGEDIRGPCAPGDGRGAGRARRPRHQRQQPGRRRSGHADHRVHPEARRRRRAADPAGAAAVRRRHQRRHHADAALSAGERGRDRQRAARAADQTSS